MIETAMGPSARSSAPRLAPPARSRPKGRVSGARLEPAADDRCRPRAAADRIVRVHLGKQSLDVGGIASLGLRTPLIAHALPSSGYKKPSNHPERRLIADALQRCAVRPRGIGLPARRRIHSPEREVVAREGWILVR
jgi:hypothetical protein